MDAKRLLRLIICSAVAGGLTSAVYFADVSRLESTKVEESVRWARQMVSQVEALTLGAREQHEKDPLAWAIGHLAQGVEPRAIRIFRTEDRAPSQEPEEFGYDRVNGVFEYRKPFPPEGDSVLHIQFITGYRGFLNAPSRFMSDLSVAGLFLAFFVLTIGLTRAFKRPRDTSELRDDVIAWAGRAKDLLFQLGSSLKTLVEGGQRLADFATKSYDALKALRSRIHGGVTMLHDARRSLKENDEVTKKLEALAMSLIVETRKISNGAGTLATLAKDIHEIAQKISDHSKKSSDCLEKLEIELEPWAVDADVAFHSFDGIVDAAYAMNQGIRSAKSGIITQAKLIQDLRSEMSGETPKQIAR